MIYDAQEDALTFSSGRKLCPLYRAIGIQPDTLNPMYGYDGDLGEFQKEKLTSDERRELADFMVELWRAFGRSNA